VSWKGLAALPTATKLQRRHGSVAQGIVAACSNCRRTGRVRRGCLSARPGCCSERIVALAQHVVDDLIVTLNPVRKLGGALDDDLSEYLGDGERRGGIEGQVFESGVLVADGLLSQFESVQQDQKGSTLRGLTGEPELDGPCQPDKTNRPTARSRGPRPEPRPRAWRPRRQR
jgi:hypothetical protein